MIRFLFRSPSRRASVAVVVAGWFVVAPSGADAQTPAATGTVVSEAELAPPAPTDRTFMPFSAAQLSATSDSSTATLKLTSAYSHWDHDEPGDPHAALSDLFTLALATPVAKGSSSTTLGTLDGLASASTVQLQYSRYRLGGFRWAPPNGAEQKRLDEICDAAKAEYKRRLGKPYTAPCSTGFVKIYDSKEYNEYRNLFFTDSTPRMLTAIGLSAKVGYETHTYYDATSLAKSSAARTPVAVGASYTVLVPNRQWAITGEAQFQNAYKDATSQVVCPSSSGKPTITCVNGSIGQPTTTTKQLISAELRGTVLDGIRLFGITTVAVDPLVTYDVHSSTYGVDLPVYAFSASAGLTGGVRADWASDTRSWAVGVFISKPFSLFDHQ